MGVTRVYSGGDVIVEDTSETASAAVEGEVVATAVVVLVVAVVGSGGVVEVTLADVTPVAGALRGGLGSSYAAVEAV